MHLTLGARRVCVAVLCPHTPAAAMGRASGACSARLGGSSLSFGASGDELSIVRNDAAVDSAGFHRRAPALHTPSDAPFAGGAFVRDGELASDACGRRGRDPALQPSSGGHFEDGAFVHEGQPRSHSVHERAAEEPAAPSEAAAVGQRQRAGHFAAAGTWREACDDLTPRGEPPTPSDYAHGKPIERPLSAVGQQALAGHFHTDGSYRAAPRELWNRLDAVPSVPTSTLPAGTPSRFREGDHEGDGLWAAGTQLGGGEQHGAATGYTNAAVVHMPHLPRSGMQHYGAASARETERETRPAGRAALAGLSSAKGTKKELEALGLQFFEQVGLGVDAGSREAKKGDAAAAGPVAAPVAAPPWAPQPSPEPSPSAGAGMGAGGLRREQPVPRTTREPAYRPQSRPSPAGQKARAGHFVGGVTALAETSELTPRSGGGGERASHTPTLNPHGVGDLGLARPSSARTSEHGRAALGGHFGAGSSFIAASLSPEAARRAKSHVAMHADSGAVGGHLRGGGTIVDAELDPFSADPRFPYRFPRSSHQHGSSTGAATHDKSIHNAPRSKRAAGAFKRSGANASSLGSDMYPCAGPRYQGGSRTEEAARRGAAMADAGGAVAAALTHDIPLVTDDGRSDGAAATRVPPLWNGERPW